MSKFEKIFIIVSSAIIVSFIGLYTYRFFHYYNIYSKVEDAGVALYDHILTSNTDNLYKNDDMYYFRGNVSNNYVLYSGKLWRIISLDNGQIKLITDSNMTTLSYGNSYRKSLVRKWLNPSEELNNGIFYNSIDVNYIDFMDVCVDKIESNPTCNDIEEDLIGLLSVKDYNMVGGSDSYLNNNTSYWLSNSSNTGNYYATTDSLKTSKFNNYQSYGVRPVVILSAGVIYQGGSGTIDEPFTIESREVKTLADTFSGEYVSYKDHKFIISAVNDEVTLMLDEVLTTMPYGTNNEFDISKKNTVAYYLNDFYKTLGDTVLSKYNNGIYSNYDYLTSYSETIESYIGLPSIGDMFNSKFNNIFLLNKSNDSKSIYTISNTYNLYADNVSKELGVVPVIKLSKNLSITSGNGFNNPYVIGGATDGRN